LNNSTSGVVLGFLEIHAGSRRPAKAVEADRCVTAAAGQLVLGLVFATGGAGSGGADNESIESLQGDFGDAAGHGSIYQRWHGKCRFACMAQSPRVELL
jgi:hypothetical protein